MNIYLFFLPKFVQNDHLSLILNRSLGGQGNFSLIMDVFKDIDYRQPYASQDYPVFKSLSDNLYIQYSINTSNPNLVVRAETCRATPTNRPYDTPQYVFIADG
jgi:hypothetical protein